MRVNRRPIVIGLATVAMIVGVSIPGSAALAAAPLFVAPGGSDSNACSAAKPCATISHAVSLAAGNSTIIVAHGTYHDDVILTKRISLIGQNTPVIDATGRDNGILISGSGANRASVRGFTVENANFEGILVMRANDVQVLDNNVLHNDRGMFAANPTGECAAQGDIPGDCGEGLHLMTSSGTQVIGNTVRDNSGGILLTDEFGPTANNQLLQNTVTDNQYDCGITLASHSSTAVVNGRPQPQAGGVHDNLISGNVVNDNGIIGFGGGILMAAAGPGGGAWGNRVIGNESNGNGLSGVTIHSHAPNQYVNDNAIIGNRLSHDALTGNDGRPGDVDFGDTGTTGILVASAVVPVSGIQIVGNQISNVHYGIFLHNVTTTTQVLHTNSFFHVDVPVQQQ